MHSTAPQSMTVQTPHSQGAARPRQAPGHRPGSWAAWPRPSSAAPLPWAMVLLSSSRLRKESEATWGFPQRSVSSSTSSSNLIQRAVSRQWGSWLRSSISSFSSTNTWGGVPRVRAWGGHQVGPAALGMWVMGQAGREGGKRWEERQAGPKGPSPRGLVPHGAAGPVAAASSSCAGRGPGRWHCPSRSASETAS